jgi:hypothetical protein
MTRRLTCSPLGSEEQSKLSGALQGQAFAKLFNRPELGHISIVPGNPHRRSDPDHLEPTIQCMPGQERHLERCFKRVPAEHDQSIAPVQFFKALRDPSFRLRRVRTRYLLVPGRSNAVFGCSQRALCIEQILCSGRRLEVESFSLHQNCRFWSGTMCRRNGFALVNLKISGTLL